MFDIKENLKTLPDCPGVYLHKDKLGQVIYVGKAVSLRNRVRQYFQNPAGQSPKVRAMVSHIAEFEYITCQTEMEALILECNLIKKYAPKYNILLRDDKTYPYIKVTTSEAFPRVVKTRLLEKDGNRYFGPFSDTGAVNRMVDLLNQIFRLKRCAARAFPKGHRPCLNYHIGQCRGVCVGEVSQEAYAQDVEGVLSFLSGHQKPLLDLLTARMEQAAASMQYEEAAHWRDAITSAKAIGELQRVTMLSAGDLDVVLPVSAGDSRSIALFMVRGGKLSGRETFAMQAGPEDSDESLVAEFLKQYYSQWAQVPREILLSKPLAEAPVIEAYLESLGEGRKVRIYVPQRGDKRALLQMAMHDAEEMSRTLTARLEAGAEKDQALAAELESVLGFHRDSYRVESYDISNTNGVDTVGAMVVFEGRKPVRRDYRRFRIRTVDRPDDYASLQEMLFRRFRRAQADDPGFRTLPDLILMDGGRGQVTAAEKVLVALGIPVPVLGMVKDDNHRTRALVNGQGEEMPLREHPLLFQYCGTIQEEVHRFAIEYHRSLHTKNAIGSVLDNIKGIGPVKRNALLTHFGSVEEIRHATAASLMQVPGISARDAQAVTEYFSRES